MKIVLIDKYNEADAISLKNIFDKLRSTQVVHVASTGYEVIALLNDYFEEVKPLPSIIYLDLNYPDKDAVPFIEALKKLSVAGKDQVTVVISTPNSFNARAKEIPVEQVLKRPLSEEEILAALGVKG